MKTTKHLVTRAMLPLLAMSLACTSAQAKGTKIHPSHHARSAMYFESSSEMGGTTGGIHFYAPPRGPGWHDETGS